MIRVGKWRKLMKKKMRKHHSFLAARVKRQSVELNNSHLINDAKSLEIANMS